MQGFVPKKRWGCWGGRGFDRKGRFTERIQQKKEDDKRVCEKKTVIKKGGKKCPLWQLDEELKSLLGESPNERGGKGRSPPLYAIVVEESYLREKSENIWEGLHGWVKPKSGQ